ncbi:MAG: hypothetical protein P4L87_04270 [Formivibrio sp.]|nr:hypothetical protein [Formivibrio sp.]
MGKPLHEIAAISDKFSSYSVCRQSEYGASTIEVQDDVMLMEDRRRSATNAQKARIQLIAPSLNS